MSWLHFPSKLLIKLGLISSFVIYPAIRTTSCCIVDNSTMMRTQTAKASTSVMISVCVYIAIEIYTPL